MGKRAGFDDILRKRPRFPRRDTKTCILDKKRIFSCVSLVIPAFAVAAGKRGGGRRRRTEEENVIIGNWRHKFKFDGRGRTKGERGKGKGRRGKERRRRETVAKSKSERTHYRQKENKIHEKILTALWAFKLMLYKHSFGGHSNQSGCYFPKQGCLASRCYSWHPDFFPLRPSGLIHLLLLSFRFADRAPSGKDRKCPFPSEDAEKGDFEFRKRIPFPPLCSTQFLFRFLSFPSMYSHSNSAPTPPPPFFTRFSRRTRDSTIRSTKHKLVSFRRLNIGECFSPHLSEILFLLFSQCVCGGGGEKRRRKDVGVFERGAFVPSDKSAGASIKKGGKRTNERPQISLRL